MFRNKSLLFIWGPHLKVLRCSVLRGHSRQCLEDSVECQGLNPGCPCALKTSFPLCYCSGSHRSLFFKNVLDLFSFCFSVSLSLSMSLSFLIFWPYSVVLRVQSCKAQGTFVVPGMEPELSVAANSVPRFREVLDPSCWLARRMLSNTFCSWWCLWGHDLVVKNKERSSRQDSGCHCEEEDKEQKTLVSAGPKHSLGEALDLLGPQ